MSVYVGQEIIGDEILYADLDAEWDRFKEQNFILEISLKIQGFKMTLEKEISKLYLHPGIRFESTKSSLLAVYRRIQGIIAVFCQRTTYFRLIFIRTTTSTCQTT